MKKIFLLILVLISISFLIANDVALLSSVKGKVSLQRDKKNVNFKAGDMLRNKDEIRTGGESFAAYKFIDATATIKVFANSVVEINADKKGKNLNKNVKVSGGSVLSSIKGSGSAFQVETPTTVASVRGTEFLTKVNADGSTLIIVTEGTVLVESKLTGETKSVSKGSTGYVDSDGAMDVEPTTPGQIDELEQAELDASQPANPKTMRIQVTDENGNIRYINVTY